MSATPDAGIVCEFDRQRRRDRRYGLALLIAPMATWLVVAAVGTLDINAAARTFPSIGSAFSISDLR